VPEWKELVADASVLKAPPALVVLSGLLHELITTVTGSRHTVPVLLRSTPFDEALLHLPIAGVALSGSAEIRPGLKDYSPLAEVLELLETED
jgi:hypothetical protein